MVVSQINNVLRQALHTFTNTEGFPTNLELLRNLLKCTTAADVSLDPKFKSDALWVTPDKAPVSYINIFENDLLTMGIFILRPGMKIPLHDHPQMFGLVKVLMGQIRITSFSVNDILNNCVINATKDPDIIMDNESDVCMLEPVSRNIHEIESIGGPAAFLDILSPPYSKREGGDDVRECTYFMVKECLGGSLFKLQQIKPPNWFWTDHYEYDGPEIIYQTKRLFHK
ncbi:2-aminoethanethiol dioxygenase-like [Onthophagus taurus]|uniref:2-aminoethanethiol dioxygenase-like n=1 Tax=Onthophagus taurus TaxID=166361 RepID=UPI000C1FE3E5|nr:2-aminoethanethiol dioxygenase-like [Onthophagus taurus]